jgi:phenylacetate-coenzyme A ligase PaaK-like adenylate-forming protein
VVVFTGIEHGILRQADRDLFWQIFQVPLFEQLRGLGGELLAVECEAHHGLHICTTDSVLELEESPSGSELVYTSLTSLEYPLVRLATGLAGDVHSAPCECGDATPRLTGLRRLPRSQSRTMAAAAD